MDRLYCKLLVIILLCLFSASAGAQEAFYMVDGNTIEVNTCLHPFGYLLDDGGQTDDYSNNFDGYVILSAPLGVTITVSGSYYTESISIPIFRLFILGLNFRIRSGVQGLCAPIFRRTLLLAMSLRLRLR